MVKRPGLWMLAGVCTTLLGVLVAVLSGGNRGGADLRDQAEQRSTPPTTVAIRAVMPQLQEFVEQRRGLQFKRRVRTLFLDDAAFERRIRAETRAPMVEAKRRERLFQALGLIPPDLDLADAESRSMASGILGLYVPDSASLIVRGTEPTPLTRMTLVHELTHALQDQHFNLKVSRTRAVLRGHTAVVEGDARRIENLYVQTLTPEEVAIAELELKRLGERAEAMSSLPGVLGRFAMFPYEHGSAFATSLVELQGQAALDKAFRAPPRSDEQVLHAERFLAGEAVADVAVPKADARAVQTDVFGEFGLRVLLDGYAEDDVVEEAASGWGADRYVTWADGARSCVRLNVAMDTPADAEQLVTLLDRWALRQGASVEGRSPIVVTSCH